MTTNKVVSLNESIWAVADAAHAKGQEAYVEWCRALCKLNATQEEIAERYDVSQSLVAQSVKVGKDERIIINYNNLPRSRNAVYLLTTIKDDRAFQELATPAATIDQIKSYKASVAPTPAPEVVDVDPTPAPVIDFPEPDPVGPISIEPAPIDLEMNLLRKAEKIAQGLTDAIRWADLVGDVDIEKLLWELEARSLVQWTDADIDRVINICTKLRGNTK